LKIKSVGADAKFKGYVLGQEETAEFIKKMDIRISKGSLPRPGEIIVNEHILRAKGLDVGDYCTVNDKRYLISGILAGENVTSFTVDDVPEKSREYLVVFKDGMMESAAKMLNGYSKTKLSVWGYHENVEYVEETLAGTRDLLNLMVVSSIIFLSIVIGNYSRIFYIHRIREFGVLKAIGYSRKKLLSKVLLEILVTSCAGLAAGFLLMAIVNWLVSVLYMYPNGNAPVQMRWGIMPKLIPIPLAISVFVFMPVSRLLDKIDPIVIIERTGN
jgi:ABC-type antimicrobial peptide transport system permease subunit